jgi:hypothetical protein
MAPDQRPSPLTQSGRLSSAKKSGAAVQETACGLAGTVTARDLQAGQKLRRDRIPRAPPDGRSSGQDALLRGDRAPNCDTFKMCRDGMARANALNCRGRPANTGEPAGQVGPPRPGSASPVPQGLMPTRHNGQGGRHVEAGCSMCMGCASSERCRGQKPHERRPGNLPSDTVGKMPGPAMRSVRCPIRTARWGTHDAEAQRQACVDGLRTHRTLFQPSPAVLTRFR